VVVLIVVPLIQLGRGGGEATPPGATPVPTVAETPPPGTAQVPNTIGMTPADAIDAANAAGLNWTLQCIQDESLPPTIYDQEPPAGTLVAPGSRFTMYSPRIEDCD
jgi:beta-lactam-binding protein with PASTA domain